MNNDTPKRYATSILIVNKANRVLAVSSRDDHDSFGLIGGKMDPCDATVVDCARREMFEETQLRPFTLREVYQKTTPNFIDVTYFGDIGDGLVPLSKINKIQKEKGEGIVAWVDFEKLYTGRFGTYNRFIKTLWDNDQELTLGSCYANTRTGERIKYVMPATDAYYLIESNMLKDVMLVRKGALLQRDLIPITEEIFREDVSKDPVFALNRKVRTFVVKTHHSTNHYYDKTRLYTEHLADVIDVFSNFKNLIPAKDHDWVENGLWAHDGMEDARMLYTKIMDVAGRSAAELAFALTNHRGRNRKERSSDEYYAYIRDTEHGPFAKLCDKIANVEYSKFSGGDTGGWHKKELSAFELRLRRPGDGLDKMWDYLKEIIEY